MTSKQRVINEYVLLVLKVGILFLAFFLVSYHTLDPDFGWHLQGGNYIRQHGIPSHDIYTYTALNFHWINHEWLSDVWLSIIFSVGGFFAASVFYSGLWTAAIFLGGRLRMPFFVLGTATIGLINYSGVRAVAWSVLGFAVLLRMIASHRTWVRNCIPLLFLFWANFHGGFILGLFVLSYTAVIQRKVFWAFILGASILMSFVNPYGPWLYQEIFRTLFDRELHGQITEWFPLHLSLGSTTYVLLWGAGFALFSKKKIKDWLSLNSLLLLGSLSASRNTPLFVIASMRDLEVYYLNFRDNLKTAFHEGLDWPRKFIVAVLVTLISVGIAWSVYNNRNFLNHHREDDYPVQAVAFLRSHPCKGNLFNDYDYGGYIIWQLPNQPVYIDGRMPSWRNPMGQKYFNIYIDVLRQNAVQQEEFRHFNVQCALLKTKNDDVGLAKRLLNQKWKVVVNSKGSFLLIAPK